jgi:hypothetical protein
LRRPLIEWLPQILVLCAGQIQHVSDASKKRMRGGIRFHFCIGNHLALLFDKSVSEINLMKSFATWVMIIRGKESLVSSRSSKYGVN